ncbi:MAG: hypothetical protein SOY62_07890, partial [Streptococcus orisratti]|nr:hypothetical protein [Streptococcus orisratti]
QIAEKANRFPLIRGHLTALDFEKIRKKYKISTFSKLRIFPLPFLRPDTYNFKNLYSQAKYL